MMPTALEQLCADARALPGEKAAAGLPRAADRALAQTAGESLDPALLAARVGGVLHGLAARVADKLPHALALAGSAWDQVDSLTIFDGELLAELAFLRRAARALADDPDAARRAGGTQAELTLDAAAGLVGLLERKLATLVRLRLRANTPALLDAEGRPFLNVAAALSEAAREWA